jgi:hypothetical protein
MILLIVVAWVVMGFIGYAMGESRDRAAAGFFWGFMLGPIGWLIILFGPNPRREKEKELREVRAQEIKMQKLQEEHLLELKKLRESIASKETKVVAEEDKYWVRIKGRELGPIDKMELFLMYSEDKITLDTEVSLALKERIYRPLGDEVPSLRKRIT